MTLLASDPEPPVPDEVRSDRAQAADRPPELPRLPSYYLKHVWNGLAPGKG